MKNIVILGSTGSIGTSALEVVRSNPGRFRVVGLTAGANHELLSSQIKEFKPLMAALSSKDYVKKLDTSGTDIKVLGGIEGICEVASMKEADFVLTAIVGFAGLLPTMAAIRACKTIGLANKETLVTAGEAVMREARKKGVKILPVDSEHNAVYQCMEGSGPETVRKIILTASGGPFVGKTARELQNVTIEDALNHPNWSMGRKITIDSATLMNKGLEVIEARFLFDFPPEKIDVVVHPESIIHSMVEFTDRGLLAQLSVPDMKGPIAYALSHPLRAHNTVKPLDLAQIGSLTFRRPDTEAFPCLRYAYDALMEGGSAPAVLNAANEVAVEAFLNRQAGFTDIPVIIRETMRLVKNRPISSVEDAVETDREARKTALEILRQL